MIVIHHNKDLDGFASGAICKRAFPDATLIGWDYKDPIPWDKIPTQQEIIMIDISFPIADMISLRQYAHSLTVIDHHISFKKDFDQAFKDVPFETHGINYIYKENQAACEIGWDYLFPGTKKPLAIHLLGMYDTWRKDDPIYNWEDVVLPFQYYMRVECTSAESFPLHYFDIDSTIGEDVRRGKVIVKYQSKQDRLACERSAFTAYISSDGNKDVYEAICLNTRAFSSNTMVSIYNPEKHDLMIGFEFTGTKWSVSLRSDKPEVDVSIIAKFRGGGGHKAAAGFECDKFEDIFWGFGK
ncbi:MAG: hypothetical protein WCK63_18765 [Betaproteobacteria bacterium]